MADARRLLHSERHGAAMRSCPVLGQRMRHEAGAASIAETAAFRNARVGRKTPASACQCGNLLINILKNKEVLMKLVSWNVNGLRAVSAKPEWRWFAESTADIIGLQETKAHPGQLADSVRAPEGWYSYWASSTVRKGYSGVAVFSRRKPLRVACELPVPEFQGEGRLLHLEFPEFHYFNGYFPNGGAEVLDDDGKPVPGEFKRLDYKMGFFAAFARHAEALRRDKPVVVCGDFNIAHQAIDLARPRQNVRNTGFLPRERAWMDAFVASGYVDTFRHAHPDEEGRYSWWSYKSAARPRNIGWRIDYFFVSEELRDAVRDAWIEDDVFGSDHCPVGLELDI